MDGSTLDHSDSDSGDSWTILEHNPAYRDDAPGFVDNNPVLDRDTADSNIDKDEDTDGISIISDSEPESSTPCEFIQDKCVTEESRPTDLPSPQYISFSPLPPNSRDHEESIRSEDDFLGDNTGKHKTYVHRRNKRLSTVLNIIMLGSVITAAGVAIGHMWGARNECSIHTTPSINKILSNLYKLQEENTYLRNKLKELSFVSTQIQRKVNTADKVPFKQLRCKKVYEEPLNSKNTERITKCVDAEPINNVDKNLNNHLIQPEYEKEFVRDVEKLKHIYQQNRSWLDEVITKRMKHEEELIKAVKSPLSSITEEQKVLQDENMKLVADSDSNQSDINISPDAKRLIEIELDAKTNDNEKPILTLKKITYADSLKSDQSHKLQKREINKIEEKDRKYKTIKKKVKDKDVTFYDVNFSEEELKKDDRYIGPKPKQEKKKRDRQKLHKKQKRRNKYEQWEMKGGYMKDYDDFSITSFLDNDFAFKKPDGNKLSRQFEKVHYINQFSETDSNQNINVNTKPKEVQNNKKVEKSSGKNKGEDVNWYDKRAALRTEARKRLEHELFGETSPNNAGWYFRRMQKREQCRAKSDNSTYKKLSKRNMNFKMKH